MIDLKKGRKIHPVYQLTDNKKKHFCAEIKVYIDQVSELVCTTVNCGITEKYTRCLSKKLLFTGLHLKIKMLMIKVQKVKYKKKFVSIGKTNFQTIFLLIM